MFMYVITILKGYFQTTSEAIITVFKDINDVVYVVERMYYNAQRKLELFNNERNKIQ